MSLYGKTQLQEGLSPDGSGIFFLVNRRIVPPSPFLIRRVTERLLSEAKRSEREALSSSGVFFGRCSIKHGGNLIFPDMFNLFIFTLTL
jgi:hypothetical protein